MTQFQFKTEVSKLLNIVTNALYSDKDIFLRELISNAADACDKLKFQSRLDESVLQGDSEFAISITYDNKANQLHICDNGVGMNQEELIENLGTIAKSGTEAFLTSLTETDRKDSGLIGQFGVGFYASFMVANKVDVLSKKAQDTKAHLWSSDGQGAYEVSDAQKDTRGTKITLHLKDDATDYTNRARLENIIRTYSDHIDIPVTLIDANPAEDISIDEAPVNQASALWTRPKSDITEAQYTNFYQHVSHGFDEPWMTLHYRAEGLLDYTTLLFVPTTKPMDLFDPERKSKAKLYVKRVFITDDCQDLLPSYLRFMRGVIDSSDLPLNVSRELLQNNPVMTKMRTGITKKILDALKKKAENDKTAYETFWDQFGAVLKEGVHEDPTLQDTLLPLFRFYSSEQNKLISLSDYIGAMPEKQKNIYYMCGDSLEALKRSPQLEGFKAKKIDVLLLTDPVDDFWTGMVTQYKDHDFKSITRSSGDLSAFDDEQTPEAKEQDKKTHEGVVSIFKDTLGKNIKDVRVSNRLTDSPVCLVADEGDMDIRLEKMLRQHGRLEQSAQRILEINPSHPVIQAIGAQKDKKVAANGVELLYDQARILEGEVIEDPKTFAQNLSKFLVIALNK
jgi:molecular chaperone HtpG